MRPFRAHSAIAHPLQIRNLIFPGLRLPLHALHVLHRGREIHGRNGNIVACLPRSDSPAPGPPGGRSLESVDVFQFAWPPVPTQSHQHGNPIGSRHAKTTGTCTGRREAAIALCTGCGSTHNLSSIAGVRCDTRPRPRHLHDEKPQPDRYSPKHCPGKTNRAACIATKQSESFGALAEIEISEARGQQIQPTATRGFSPSTSSLVPY